MIKEELDKLIQKIVEANEKYYKESINMMTDVEYDMLVEKVKRMCDSAGVKYSIGVGSDLTDGFTKVKHGYPMLSLRNTYNIEEIMKFVNSNTSATFSVEPKADGVSMSLVYNEGTLVDAITRGDGVTGDSVIHNIINVIGVPNNIPKDISGTIRGEIVIFKEDFKRINSEREALGIAKLANARNATSGAIKSHDKKVVKERYVRFIAYDTNIGDSCITDRLAFLESLKFTTTKLFPPVNREKMSSVLEDVSFTELPYETDGLVIKVNDVDIVNSLGTNAAHPKWAIAFKYPELVETTTLRSVEWNVGRTGVVTPLAHFDTQWLAGTNVSKATLHNVKRVEELGIKIDGQIYIKKAAEIIPHVIGPADDKGTVIEIPSICPCCGTSLETNGTVLTCVNESCRDRLVKALEHAVGVDYLNLQGVGPSVIEILVDSKEVTSIYDLLNLDDITIDKVLTGAANENLKTQLELVRTTKERYRILASLGIPTIGKRAAKKFFEDIDKIGYLITSINSPSFKSKHKIGAVKEKHIVEYLDKHQHEMIWLNDYGVNTISNTSNSSGLNVCITGKHEEKRTVMEGQVLNNGDKIHYSIKKDTDILIVPHAQFTSSKVLKAEKFGAKIMTLEQYISTN